MACLLESVCSIVGVFHQYAKKKGDCLTLNRREMKRLLQKEFAEVLEKPQDPQTVKLALQLLDVNRDSVVDFHEYLRLVFEVAMACYSCGHPKESLSWMEDSCRGGLHRNSNNGRHIGEDGREVDRAHLRPIEDTTRGEMMRRSLPRESSAQTEDRNRQRLNSRDDDPRVRPSCRHQEWETERQCLVPKQQEVIERHGDADGVEPHRNESVEECQSRDCVRRRDDERHLTHDPLESDRYPSVVPFGREDERPRGTEHRESEENLNRRHESEVRGDEEGGHSQRANEIRSAIERGCPREGKDGRRALDTQGELRSCDLEHHVADERRDRMRNRTPVDDHEEHCPLPREGERRSREIEPRESEHRRRQSYSFQPREGERRTNQARNQEIRGSERRRDEDDWVRPYPREAARRSEVEGQPRRHDLERRERERSRLRSFDLENMDSGSRCSHSLGHESRGVVRRSHSEDETYSWEETQEIDGGRRRPLSSEPESRNHEYSQDSDRRRPQRQESAQRVDHQGRHQYYETESWDGGRGSRRQPMLLEPETPNGNGRRLPELTSRYREGEGYQETDFRMRREERSPSNGGRRELDSSRLQGDSRCRVTERSGSALRNRESSGKD